MKWQNHIGLDIGSATIKLVQVALAGSEKYRLVALGLVETPAFTDQLTWDRARTEAIKRLVKESRVNTKQVAVSLPETQVYTRVVEMPFMEEPDLSSTIRWQAEQYIPVPLSDVVLKHQVLSVPEQSIPGSKMEVLLVAAPNEILSRYTMMLANSGLEVVAVETETLAAARSVISMEENPPTSLLVHLGAEATSLAIFKKGLLVLVQSVNYGGAMLARTVSSQLGLENKQSGEYVKTYGLDETKLEGKVAGAIKPIIELIVTEIKRVTAFYQSKETTDTLARVVLTGGLALLPGLIPFLTANLSIEVQLGNPFMGVELSSVQKQEIGENGPVFSTALGLAIKPVS